MEINKDVVEVHRVLLDIVSSAANVTPRLGRYPPFKREVVAIASAALESFKNEAKKMVVALVDMERAFVPPQHFIRLVQRRDLTIIFVSKITQVGGGVCNSAKAVLYLIQITQENKKGKMRPNNKSSPSSSKRANRTQPINPNSSPRSSASLLDSPLSASDNVKTLDDLQEQYTANPHSFPYSVKEQCWEKAERVKSQNLDRWRRDPLGNLVFRDPITISYLEDP
ncbi:uncharacterized protein A4U43_C03F9720 [Asparagus officinalis]|uniref:Uncharacterized protein n=1 Tax=Asparagus officinalis TaxID=4686 RepID=A0A5P1F8T7_ASPOF|nr:uncharacterized protein A4U43_C03F9720 [Asparagus officinalis]